MSRKVVVIYSGELFFKTQTYLTSLFLELGWVYITVILMHDHVKKYVMPIINPHAMENPYVLVKFEKHGWSTLRHMGGLGLWPIVWLKFETHVWSYCMIRIGYVLVNSKIHGWLTLRHTGNPTLRPNMQSYSKTQCKDKL